MSIEVKEVTGIMGRLDFINFPWKLHYYRNDPNWVPPLKVENLQRMSERFNPFFKNARAKYYMAFRDGRPVGRISAHEVFNFNKFQNLKWGYFGWFECEDYPETAKALIDTAERQVKEWGLDTIVGPMNYTVNHECGLLIDGFDTPPMILMTHNPPYYQKLIEACGYDKAQDLFAYRMDSTEPVPEGVRKIADHIRMTPNVKFRTWDIKNNLRSEIIAFHEIYNAAWNRNWGFCPLELDELLSHEMEFKFLLDEEISFMAEVEGKPAGFSLSLPNINEAIIHMNGSVKPGSILKFLKARKNISGLRVFALGVKPEYRSVGIGAVFYADTLTVGHNRGYKWGEMSWILESNKAMNKAIQTMGGKIYKTYRVFKKSVA